MDAFEYREGRLFAEDVPCEAIAERFGTPCYVYSRAALERHWRAFDMALTDRPHLVCFAVKANSNLAVLNVLARLGAGFDIVSVGELERVLAAGGEPAKVVFSGVGKRVDEMRRALEVGIRCFNVESLPELERLSSVAGQLGVRAPVSLRVNPDVDARTHPYIATGLRESKFGIDIDEALAAYRHAGWAWTGTSAPSSPAWRHSWTPWTGSWNWWTAWSGKAWRSATSTWAGAWASATPTRPLRCPRSTPLRWKRTCRAVPTRCCWSPAGRSPATPASF
jgi:hypothetical protein